jgi:hypothetical protein
MGYSRQIRCAFDHSLSYRLLFLLALVPVDVVVKGVTLKLKCSEN